MLFGRSAVSRLQYAVLHVKSIEILKTPRCDLSLQQSFEPDLSGKAIERTQLSYTDARKMQQL